MTTTGSIPIAGKLVQPVGYAGNGPGFKVSSGRGTRRQFGKANFDPLLSGTWGSDNFYEANPGPTQLMFHRMWRDSSKRAGGNARFVERMERVSSTYPDATMLETNLAF